jgi:transposase InsO family protein
MIGWIIKPIAFKESEPMRKNSPTVPGLVVDDERDLVMERERLSRVIDRFSAAGPEGCTTHPHSFFGRLTPEEWSLWMYKHLDHHLRQFGV